MRALGNGTVLGILIVITCFGARSLADICPTVANYSLSIGPAYAAITAPPGQLLVQNGEAIGCTNVLNKLDVNGNLAGGTCACNYQAPSNSLVFSGAGSFGSCVFNNTAPGGPALIQSLSSNTSQPQYSGFSTSAAGTGLTSGPSLHLYQSAPGTAVNVIGAKIGSVFFGGSKDTVNTLVDSVGVYGVTNQVWNSTFTGGDLVLCTSDPGGGSPTCTEAVRATGSGTLRLASKTTSQIVAMSQSQNGEVTYDSTQGQVKARLNSTWMPIPMLWNMVAAWDVADANGNWTGSGAMSVGILGGAAGASVVSYRQVTTAAQGNWVQLTTGNQAPGAYVVAFSILAYTDRGVLTLTEQTTSTTLLNGIDMFGPNVNLWTPMYSNILVLTSPTSVTLRWTASTKNRGSNYVVAVTGAVILYKIA